MSGIDAEGNKDRVCGMEDFLMENYRVHKVGINPPVIDRRKVTIP